MVCKIKREETMSRLKIDFEYMMNHYQKLYETVMEERDELKKELEKVKAALEEEKKKRKH